MGSPQLSEYELQRESRISRNLKHLQSLGLDQFKDVAAIKKTKTNAKHLRRKKETVASIPSRRSTRVIQQPLSGDIIITQPHETSTKQNYKSRNPSLSSPQPYITTQLSKKTKSIHKFQKNKTHQHLTISPDLHTIATTGCAGYGVSLTQPSPSSPPSSSSSPSQKEYKIEVVHLGTGGFGVGLATIKWRGPYKSVGKSQYSYGVYHSSGELHANGKTVESFAPAYNDGDVITISLVGDNLEKKKKKSDGREVVFRLNGEVVGKVCIPSHDKDEYICCIQPYMGGVARLL